MRELDKARAYAESLIKNAPDPVFVSDLEGKILQANDAVFAAPRVPPGRVDRAIAVADLISRRRPASSSPRCARWSSAKTNRRQRSGERRVTRNVPLNPRTASRRSHPDQPERLGLARPGRQGHRRDRHPPRHARAGQGPGLRREPDQERPRPGVRLRPGRQDPPGQRRGVCRCSASGRTS